MQCNWLNLLCEERPRSTTGPHIGGSYNGAFPQRSSLSQRARYSPYSYRYTSKVFTEPQGTVSYLLSPFDFQLIQLLTCFIMGHNFTKTSCYDAGGFLEETFYHVIHSCLVGDERKVLIGLQEIVIPRDELQVYFFTVLQLLGKVIKRSTMPFKIVSKAYFRRHVYEVHLPGFGKL